MNEKLMNQVAEMKKQTIGVEVEMNSIARSKAAKLAAEFFGTGRWQDTARRNGYSTWSAWDAQGRPGPRVEIPEGRQHPRPGQRKVRDGHPDPDLRRHRPPAGADPAAAESWSQERCHQRVWSTFDEYNRCERPGITPRPRPPHIP